MVSSAVRDYCNSSAWLRIIYSKLLESGQRELGVKILCSRSNIRIKNFSISSYFAMRHVQIPLPQLASQLAASFLSSFCHEDYRLRNALRTLSRDITEKKFMDKLSSLEVLSSKSSR